MPRRRKAEKMPEEFKTYEEAAEFWDTHDSTKLKDILDEVKMDVDIRERHYLIEIDEDVAKALHKNAHRKGIPDSALANELLRKQLVEKK